MSKKSPYRVVRRYPEAFQLGAAVLFLLLVGVFAAFNGASVAQLGPSAAWLLIVAAMAGAYMAMNIGANDVANNMGPAVGSGALSLGWALVVAFVFEALGAIVAGGEVIGTIKGRIIDPNLIADPAQGAWAMFAALLAASLWINAATAMGAPVSTTHSIIGALMGAGVAAGGWALVNWPTMGAIAVSWVVSPLLGGALAAAFLYLIKRSVTYRGDMLTAASQVVPLLIAAMVWAYTTYMLLKGLGQLVQIRVPHALGVGGLAGGVAWLMVRRPIARLAARQENGKKGVNRLFIWPLIGSAALLSFAHGANDVANAVGPLAAIYEAVTRGALVVPASAPFWILVVGALGLSIGLALYGSRLIRIVGREITELDNMRAYAIAMSATLTVIVASQLGMPVSTTHIAIGAVFGVGFLRELLKVNYAKMERLVRSGHQGADRDGVEAYLRRFEAAEVGEKQRMLADMKQRARQHGVSERAEEAVFAKKELKAFQKAYKQELVKRSVVTRIVVAWILTLPATAVLAALLFYVVRAVLN